MLQIHPITHFDDPRLAPYRTLREQEDHHRQNIFVAEGEKVVRRLLTTELEIISIVLPDKWLASFHPLIEARREQINVFTAPKETLEKLIGFHLFQGVMAVVKIPPSPDLSSVIHAASSPKLFVAVDGLSGVDNLGTIVRNAVAFGAQALIMGETCSSPYLRRAVRTSMGTIFKLPVIHPPNLATALRTLRSQNIRCLAAHPHTDRQWLWQADLKSDCCIILGSEGLGVSPAVLEACDEMVAIPMHSEVDSLNVGSAAAAFFYEAARQRAK